MRRLLRSLAVVLLLGLFGAPPAPAAADALCCVNPNLPVGQDEAVRPLETGALRFSLGTGYTRHATPRSGGRILRIDDDDHAHHGHGHDDHGASPIDGFVMDLLLAVGAGRGLSAQLSAPLVYIQGEMGSLAGVGDPKVTAGWTGAAGGLGLSVGAGFSVPVGTVGAEAAVEDTTGATVSTGTVDPLFSGAVSWPVGGVSMHAGLDGRLPLYETSRGDRSGHQLGARAGLGLPVNDVLAAGLDLQYRFRHRDQVLGEVQADSGGHWLYAVPAVHWAVAPAWSIEGRAFIPVYQWVNGTQLGHDFAVSVGLSTRLGGAGGASRADGPVRATADTPSTDRAVASRDVADAPAEPSVETAADETGAGDAAPAAPTDRQIRRMILRGEALPALSATVPTVYDFWAEWCQPCHALEEKLNHLLAERPDGFILRKVDVTRWDEGALEGLVGAGGVLPYVRVVATDGTVLVAGSGTPGQLLGRVTRTLFEE